MGDPIHWVLGTVTRGDAQGRLAESVALHLRAALPSDHLVLPRYAPRDRGERIPVVIIGRERVFVVEPRDEEGDLVCYQDHWYRRAGPGIAHALSDPPSLRARRNAARIRSDLGTGGYLHVPIDAAVLLTRGAAADVRSSCVPVVAGVDALIAHVLHGIAPEAAPERTRALADALARNIRLSAV